MQAKRRKERVRRLGVDLVGAAFLTLMLIAACAPPVAQPAPVSEEAVTLRYWQYMTEHETQERAVIARFEEKYPNIKVNLEIIPDDTYFQKLNAEYVAGSPPDIFNGGAPDSGWPYWDKLLDLKPFIEANINKDDYFYGFVDAQNLAGKYVGLPRNWVDLVMFYNKDLFDEAGIEYPNEHWTWEEDLLNAAKALTKDTDGDGNPDQWGFWTGPDVLNMDGYVYASGGAVLSEDKSRCLLDSPESIESIQFRGDLDHER